MGFNQSVICDTNIWYGLANNQFDVQNLKDVNLYGTSVNVTEISSTPNLINNFDLVVRTVNAFHKYHYKVITPNPMEYLISTFHPEYNPNTKTETRLLNHFNTLGNIKLSDIPQTDIIDTEKQIQELTDSGKEYVTKLNNDLIKIRKDIKLKTGLKKYRKQSFINKWKEYFSKLVLEYSKQHCDKEYLLDENSPFWYRVEFFLYTWESYFKNNLETGNWNLEKNDWGDLFNLVYVGPEFKYWTIEKKWNKIFDSDEILKKYKYNSEDLQV